MHELCACAARATASLSSSLGWGLRVKMQSHGTDYDLNSYPLKIIFFRRGLLYINNSAIETTIDMMVAVIGDEVIIRITMLVANMVMILI